MLHGAVQKIKVARFLWTTVYRSDRNRTNRAPSVRPEIRATSDSFHAITTDISGRIYFTALCIKNHSVMQLKSFITRLSSSDPSDLSISSDLCTFLEVYSLACFHTRGLWLHESLFHARKQLLFSARISHRNSARLSITRVDQSKTVQARITPNESDK